MTEIARMYGGSLYDLAAEEGLETRILGELEEVNALFKANPKTAKKTIFQAFYTILHPCALFVNHIRRKTRFF